MFKIEVHKGSIAESRKVHSQRLAKDFDFIEQTVYVHVPGQPYPFKTKCTLPRGQNSAYPEGIYTTSPDDVKVSPYGEITVKVSRLNAMPTGK